jgi:xylulokinase
VTAVTDTSSYVGIDLGTSGLKGVAVDGNGSVVARAQASYKTSRPAPGASEQEPADWLAATREVLRQLKAVVAPARWLGIGLSGMIPTLVTLDKSGIPTRPSLTWEDDRAETQGRSLRELVGPDGLYRSTGQWVDGRYLLPMFLRLAEAEPAESASILTLCSAKDFLYSWLTGEMATDPSTASGFGCYGLISGGWLDNVLEAASELCALRLPALPTVAPSTTIHRLAPEVAGSLELPPHLEVCLGAADSVLGAEGLGLQADGGVAYVAGTSSVILALTTELRFDRAHRYLVTPSTDGCWGLEMDLLSTGSALEWLADVCGSSSVTSLMRLAAEVSPEDAPVFLPYLGGGEQGALWDPTLRGAIVGLELHHGRQHLARGLLNGILLESRRSMRVLEDAGLARTTVRVAGGSASPAGFRADLADATRWQVSMAEGDETNYSAIGAALLAARATDDGDFAAPKPPASTPGPSLCVEPDEKRAALWDAISRRHDAALESLRPYFAEAEQ